jgi:hypothetical protein
VVTKVKATKKTVIKVDPSTTPGTPEYIAYWEQWVKDEIAGVKHASS